MQPRHLSDMSKLEPILTALSHEVNATRKKSQERRDRFKQMGNRAYVSVFKTWAPDLPVCCLHVERRCRFVLPFVMAGHLLKD